MKEEALRYDDDRVFVYDRHKKITRKTVNVEFIEDEYRDEEDGGKI